MITEDYVSFETAKLLKEKGFDEPCHCFYEYKKRLYNDMDKYFPNGMKNSDHDKEGNKGVSAPTLQMAMKWLREVHYIHIAALCPIVDVDTDVFGVKYNVVISNLKNNCLAFNTGIEDNEYDTYEQACEAAIKYCLENLI